MAKRRPTEKTQHLRPTSDRPHQSLRGRSGDKRPATMKEPSDQLKPHRHERWQSPIRGRMCCLLSYSVCWWLSATCRRCCGVVSSGTTTYTSRLIRCGTYRVCGKSGSLPALLKKRDTTGHWSIRPSDWSTSYGGLHQRAITSSTYCCT